MILRCFLLGFLFSTSLLSQKRVTEVCWTQYVLHDSAMFHEYGELFKTCMQLDTTYSGIWTDKNHFHPWSDTLLSPDTVYRFQFFYLFQYPGARADDRRY